MLGEKSAISATLCVFLVIAAVAMSFGVQANPLSATEERDVDATVRAWIAKTQAPSVSVAIVRDGSIVYAQAYGDARRDPRVAATPQTRYGIASVTKQFTAAAILRLSDEGKLALTDSVSKYLPELGLPETVTIRGLLSHTAGIPELFPLDYVTPRMATPVTVASQLTEWAHKPLDFVPGTEWRYSNTGIDIAGAIVEKVTGLAYIDALRREIFTPLGIVDVAQRNAAPLTQADAYRYTRYAGGPARRALSPAFGWNFAGGGLVMTPTDLARWDISVMARSLFSAASYDALYAPVILKDGRNAHYSLGLGVYESDGRLNLQHGGDGFGFTAENIMWPTARTAIAVCTNNDWTPSLGGLRDDLVARLAYVVLPTTPSEARVREVFDAFRRGTIDRSRFTDDANNFFSASVLADQKTGLAHFGAPRAFTLHSQSSEGGFTQRNWTILTDRADLNATEIDAPDGRIEQFTIATAHN
jgi:CubicO group peptidase (beta-lactamase class C family)